MKIREKSRALSLIECICHIAFVYPIIAVIWYMFVNSDGTRLTVFLMVAVSEIFLYIFRKRFYKRWEFYGILVAYIGLLVLFNDVIGGIYLFAGIIITILCVIIVWSKSIVDFEVPSAGVAIILFIIGICVWLASAAKILIIFYICEAVYVFALFIYKNLKKADDFIWENRRTAFLSVEQIKNANYLITCILGIIILGVTSLSALLYTPILNLLKQPILKLLNDLFGVDIELSNVGNITDSEIDELNEITVQMSDKASPGSMIVTVMLFIIGIIAVILFIIFIIHIIKQLSSTAIDGDIKEYVIPFRSEEVSVVEVEEEEPFDDRPGKKIRKIYKKKIKSSIKKNSSVPKASTPNEQKNLAGLKGEGTEEFMKLYYKARYSNEACTEDDVEKMKSYK